MLTCKQHIRKATIRTRKNGKEYFIWCDESTSKGKFCSNFYGGVLVKSEHLREVLTHLQKVCRRLHFFDEIKWHKVSQHYVEKYMSVMDAFFRLIAEGKAKVRIMYTPNTNAANHLKEKPKSETFFILYRHFITHAFGLPHSNNSDHEIYLRLYFDNLPDTLEHRQAFKEYIKGLQTTMPFQLARLKIRKQDIAEVDSKKHLLIQMLDVVLGALCFRLNNKHKEMPPEKKQRGKRTIAKEKLYKHINKKIRTLRTGFHIGTNTAITSKEEYWQHSYQLLKLGPSELKIDINPLNKKSLCLLYQYAQLPAH
ncbi:DUF3800 domain-containing protein [Chitinophagaceae bacterium LB-8]|uniref:DUF3800 domain-containing protein n=1 Tax=Paraflavisolibacter caeni TaxID=2982496 RepID=A0A9X3BIF5_9BACT|nr:DUF3800 domain-containing protein [Paraflavisolibacter caeni]MCU7551257.1 DUF3800 domain-containing protein [Paraflavisolibacter caeni]